jgi:phage-related baseplate assembly protein
MKKSNAGAGATFCRGALGQDNRRHALVSHIPVKGVSPAELGEPKELKNFILPRKKSARAF